MDEIQKVRLALKEAESDVDDLEGYTVVKGQDSDWVHDHKDYYYRNAVVTDGTDFFRIQQSMTKNEYDSEITHESVRQVFPVNETHTVYK